jgi:hypothetical protein
MKTTASLCGAAALAAMTCGSAFAAAPELGGDLLTETVAAAPAATGPLLGPIHELETEMLVRGWVLCVSAEGAEQLARASAESTASAMTAYDGLKQARACGQFPELRVILRERLFSSAVGAAHDARVFLALVNIADNWASAYLVYGGLPAE